MNNKGFTLVELLAVIVILVSVSLIAVLGISSSLENRDLKECEEQMELSINAAKIYFSMNDSNSVTVKTLKDGNYFSSNEKIDRLSDNDTITIDVDNKKYVFTGYGECK